MDYMDYKELEKVLGAKMTILPNGGYFLDMSGKKLPKEKHLKSININNMVFKTMITRDNTKQILIPKKIKF
jgi:hypothetical protein